jgi:hypothetical protein
MFALVTRPYACRSFWWLLFAPPRKLVHSSSRWTLTNLKLLVSCTDCVVVWIYSEVFWGYGMGYWLIYSLAFSIAQVLVLQNQTYVLSSEYPVDDYRCNGFSRPENGSNGHFVCWRDVHQRLYREMLTHFGVPFGCLYRSFRYLMSWVRVCCLASDRLNYGVPLLTSNLSTPVFYSMYLYIHAMLCTYRSCWIVWWSNSSTKRATCACERHC